MRDFRRLLACGLTLLSACAVPAHAGGLGVSPVLVELESGQRSTAVTLSNGGDRPQRIQAEVFRWTRRKGEDVLEPDPRVLLNPPLFEMAAGGSQIVRLGFRGGALPPAETETAYRVFFQEVPRPEDVGTTALRMVLRIGVPVFVAPIKRREDLHWSAPVVDGLRTLQLENRGNVRARVADLHVSQQPIEGFVYVFPGETQRWTLPDAASAGPLSVSALLDHGSVRVELPVATH